MSHLMNTYGRLPVAFSHGEGSWLFDLAGKRYLDALSGIAVSTLGHNHPRLVKAISEQVSQVIHTSNLYGIPLQEALSDKLASLAGMDEVFFCNSGAEANEAAIKLARLYGHGLGIAEPAILVMEQSFHGRTLATLSATGNKKVQVGFEPLVGGFVRVPFDDLATLAATAEGRSDIVAVLVEPVQGEGGIRVAHQAYLQALRALCDERKWLLMFDEVQCGIGRTGDWFGHQSAGVRPDVMSLAKGLGSGVPIGACLAAGRATGTFKPGNHGSTFGGNPLAAAVGHTVVDMLAEKADAIGHMFMQEEFTHVAVLCKKHRLECGTSETSSPERFRGDKYEKNEEDIHRPFGYGPIGGANRGVTRAQRRRKAIASDTAPHGDGADALDAGRACGRDRAEPRRRDRCRSGVACAFRRSCDRRGTRARRLAAFH